MADAPAGLQFIFNPGAEPALATRPSVSGAFQRSVLIEYVMIIGVLAATAVLTILFSPESSK